MKPVNLLAITLLPFLSTLHADTFHLKDGRVLDGSVLEDMGDSLRLRVKITRSIFDEKVIKKSEITKTFKVDPSKEVFMKIKSKFPMADLQPVEAYRELLGETDKFLTAHASSPHSDEVKKMQITLEEELMVLKTGGTKLNGELISEADIVNNQYEYDASVIAKEFHDLVETKNYRAALDKYITLNREYYHTMPHKKAKEEAMRILPGYLNTIDQAITTSMTELENREMKLSNMNSSLRARTENFLKQESMAYEAKLEEAMAAEVTLLPLHKSRPDVMKKVKSSLAKLDQRLLAQQNTPIIDAGESYRNARKAIVNRDVLTAIEHSSELQRARVPRKYARAVAKDIQDLKVELAHKEKELQLKIKKARLEARAANSGQ